jgi:hypothetical protein
MAFGILEFATRERLSRTNLTAWERFPTFVPLMANVVE